MLRYNHKKILRFVPVIGLALLFATVRCTAPQAETDKAVSTLQPTAQNETAEQQADFLLHRRLQAVLDSDSAYAALPSGAAPAVVDEKNGGIIQAEMALQATLDSLEKEQAPDSATAGSVTGYFRAILQSRRAASDLRMSLSADSDDSVSMQQLVMQLQKKVREKDKRIAALERGAGTAAPNQGITTQLNTYAPANGESPANLRQRNKNLVLALNKLETKYFLVGRDYLLLKQEHDRILNELATLRQTRKP